MLFSKKKKFWVWSSGSEKWTSKAEVRADVQDFINEVSKVRGVEVTEIRSITKEDRGDNYWDLTHYFYAKVKCSEEARDRVMDIFQNSHHLVYETKNPLSKWI